MSAKIDAIVAVNAKLTSASLPRYDALVELLRAADNEFETMQRYHCGQAAQSIEAMRSKINETLEGYPYP